MSEDGRALEDAMAVANQAAADLADFKQTMLARQHVRPTGDMEETLRTTPKPGTLLMQGQTVDRADYPALWAWAQEQNIVGVGKAFGAGDGSTTFVIPDRRQRVGRGAGTGESTGQPVGSDSVTLTAAQLPSHKHNVGVTMTSGHAHAIFGSPNHSGHGNGGVVLVPEGSFYGVMAGPNSSGGSHVHDESVEGQNKTYTVSETNVGSGAAIDVKQAGFTVNYLIWT